MDKKKQVDQQRVLTNTQVEQQTGGVNPGTTGQSRRLTAPTDNPDHFGRSSTAASHVKLHGYLPELVVTNLALSVAICLQNRKLNCVTCYRNVPDVLSNRCRTCTGGQNDSGVTHIRTHYRCRRSILMSGEGTAALSMTSHAQYK